MNSLESLISALQIQNRQILNMQATVNENSNNYNLEMPPSYQVSQNNMINRNNTDLSYTDAEVTVTSNNNTLFDINEEITVRQNIVSIN